MLPSDSKILVVEDEFQVRALLLRILSNEGYEPISAGNAQDALDILGKETVDLILLDLRMPGPTDGEDLLFLLRDRGDEVPIIVVSAWVDDEVMLDQPDCIYAVLKKPIQFAELIDTVQRALSKK
jgi:DNA-binding NtrC family response regulator